MTERCYLNALGILCAAGKGPADLSQQLSAPADTLTLTGDYSIDGRELPLGRYADELPATSLEGRQWQSRNNQLALAALSQIEPDIQGMIERYGRHRIGVIIGTSTAGIADNEPGIRQWAQSGELPEDFDYSKQEMGAPAAFIASQLNVTGPAYGISTACSSGAKALATARRLIRGGLCDAVVAGGVDTLCGITVNGFSSLEAVSEQRCNPLSKHRNGINIGEGAALFLVSREPGPVFLAGVGENSDAHHISAPDPSGAGAMGVMQAALADAGLAASDIGYLNLHGTATRLNDQMEATAVNAVFGDQVPCSSTKPFTGHTLAAAGAIEAGICWSLVHQDMPSSTLPMHLWDGEQDADLPVLNLVPQGATTTTDAPRYALSNSFAFGGNNIALILGRSDESDV